MLERTYDAILLVCLTLMGGLQFIDLMVGQLTSNDFLRQMLLLVAAVLGLPLAAAVLWLMGSAGAYWWVWAWALWTANRRAVARRWRRMARSVKLT